jgi:hypothetical protein
VWIIYRPLKALRRMIQHIPVQHKMRLNGPLKGKSIYVSTLRIIRSFNSLNASSYSIFSLFLAFAYLVVPGPVQIVLGWLDLLPNFLLHLSRLLRFFLCLPFFSSATRSSVFQHDFEILETRQQQVARRQFHYSLLG